MYLSVWGIRDIVDWFNDPTTNERILCIPIADTHRDRDLLGSLFDDRSRLSAMLGPEVAFFLFAPGPHAELVARDDGSGKYSIVPGLVLPGAASGNRWRPIPISDVPLTERDAIIQRTQGITAELRDFFDLDRDSLPCLVFLTKNNDDPFVIRTATRPTSTLLRTFSSS